MKELDLFKKQCDDYEEFRTHAFALLRTCLYYVVEDDKFYTFQGVDGSGELVGRTKRGLLSCYDCWVYDFNIGGENKKVNIIKEYVNGVEPDVKVYDRAIFYPGVSTDDRALNLYTGFGREQTEQFSEDEIKSLEENELKPYVDHIKKCWCGEDEELYNYVDTWIGYTVKHPEIKLGVALRLKGLPCSGKTIIVTLLGEVLKNRGINRPLCSRQITTPKYNHLRANSALVSIDELYFYRGKRARNIVNRLLTENSIKVDKRYLDVYYNVITETTVDDKIPEDELERYCILNTVEIEDPDHTSNLMALDPQVLYNYFCSKEYPEGFQNIKPPHTR